MAKDKNDHVVVAVFVGENEAKTAIEELQRWDKANDDIKLGAVCTISKDGDKVKTKAGRNTGKGAKVGAVLFVASAVLTGGGTLVASAATGAVAGGAIGTLFKKSVHLNKEELQELGTKLDAGKVAVVATVDESEVAATSEKLKSLGGDVQHYEVPSEALDEVAVAAEGEAPAEAAPTA